ncbi:lactonase family protein [Demequina sediminicola]|uniref:lactonase family protein n=1 Tax=Demequina sediminicola TaxID=1095026 RepID=UPI000A98F1D7|nr:beta-propeller fold lactonase family protein [Demequina sediminicola]
MANTVWWGTYPEAGLGSPTGTGEGVWRQSASDASRALELPAPSFMAGHPSLSLLYVTSEEDASQLHVVDVSDESAPSVAASVPTGGSGACHVLISPDARTLYISHYGSGDLSVIQLDENGMPVAEAAAQVLGHAGSGPRTDRQDAPHAHSAGFGPGGHHVLVADLGTDELRRYAVRADGLLDDHGIAATLPAGSGPRHFVVGDGRGGSDLLYVACELSGTIVTLRWDAHAGEAYAIAEQPVTTVSPRSADDNYPSHIVLHDGVLFTGVRGADVIALHDLSPEGQLNYRTSIDAGHWPRHFAIIAQRLHVGAERGHEVRTYDMDDVLALPPENEVGYVAHVAHASAAMPSPAFAIALP